MILEESHLYHIYNQGNNKQRIFFSHDNYLFFLKKIKQYILPHADILAWCLMPNHFHLMVYVHTFKISVYDQKANICSGQVRNLNDSIGLILRTYTRAINKQKNRSGSLFKTHTKAECITEMNGIEPTFCNTSYEAEKTRPISEKQYAQICFTYNPY